MMSTNNRSNAYYARENHVRLAREQRTRSEIFAGPTIITPAEIAGTALDGNTLILIQAPLWDGTETSSEWIWQKNGVDFGALNAPNSGVLSGVVDGDVFRVKFTASNAEGTTTLYTNTITAVIVDITLTENVDGELEVNNATGEVTYTITAPAAYAGVYVVNSADLDTGPVNLVPPAIVNTNPVAIDDVLTFTPGLWIYDGNNAAPTINKQWQRSGVDISGATSDSYTLVGADLGTAITVEETATGTNGARTQPSAALSILVPGAPVISNNSYDDETNTATFTVTENGTLHVATHTADQAPVYVHPTGWTGGTVDESYSEVISGSGSYVINTVVDTFERVSYVVVDGDGNVSNHITEVNTGTVTVPGAPINLSATAGDTQVSLSWQAPVNNGGTPITDYQIERNSGGGFVVISTPVSTDTSYVDTGLTNGVQYAYRVSAINSAGTGAASNSAAAIPAFPPPLWDEPAYNNTTKVFDSAYTAGDRYDVAWYNDADGEPAFSLGDWIGTTQYITGGPLESTPLSIDVQAGTGITADRVKFVLSGPGGQDEFVATASTGSATVPDAPTSLVATAGDTQVSLTWTAPASNGGSAITDYQIERDSGGGFAVITDGVNTNTNYTDTGLTNGTAYTYRVSAVNSIGTGPASNTDSATPAGASFNPADLFGGGDTGFYAEPTLSNCFQDAAGLTAAGVGDPVRRINDASGTGNNLVAPSDAARPILRQDGGGKYYLECDGSSDYFEVDTFVQPTSPTMYVAIDNSTALSTRTFIRTGPSWNVIFRNNVGTAQFYYPTTSGPTYSHPDETAPLIIGGYGESGVGPSVLRVNGVEQGNVNITASVGTGATEMAVFGAPGGGGHYGGNAYAVFYINRLLTAQEISDLETYLADLNGVTLP